MKIALLFLTLFHMNAALAQFGAVNSAPYAQVPHTYGYGNQGYTQGLYSVMPGQGAPLYSPFQRQAPMFQQNPMFGGWGGYGGGFNPQSGYGIFPPQQMGGFGGNQFGGGGGGGSPRMNINLNFNLDQLFGLGGGGSTGGNGGWLNDGAPVCEDCERRRRHERIRISDDRESDEPEYHTEARSRYVRQANDYPSSVRSSPAATLPPAAAPVGGGDRVASGEDADDLPEVYRAPTTPRQPTRHLPPVATPRLSGVVSTDDPRSNIHVSFRVSVHNTDERRAQGAPIWNLFITNFLACVPAGCEPANYASYGGRGHGSCHPQGMAMDVHAIRCAGDPRLHRAIDNDPLFNRMVVCMGGSPGNHVSRGRMAVLWHQHTGRGRTEDHWDHAHFSPPGGCITNGHRQW